MTYLKLTIEPIASSSAMASLAKLLPKSQWDRIRRTAYKQAGYRCRICGKDARLHCHEVWHYNERTGYQWLMGFQALCEDCHGVKHILSIRDEGTLERLARHFMEVNRVGYPEFQRHLEEARMKQRERNEREWHISFGSYSFQVPVLKDREQRERYVEVERPQYKGADRQFLDSRRLL